MSSGRSSDELRRLLATHIDAHGRRPPGRRPGPVAPLGAMGVFALAVPEADGGVELGLADAAVVPSRSWVGPRPPGPSSTRSCWRDVVEGAETGAVVVGITADDEPAVVEHLDDLDVLVVDDGEQLRRLDAVPEGAPGRPTHSTRSRRSPSCGPCRRAAAPSPRAAPARARGALLAAAHAGRAGTGGHRPGRRPRQGAPAVRPSDRRLPGGEAPARRRRRRASRRLERPCTPPPCRPTRTATSPVASARWCGRSSPPTPPIAPRDLHPGPRRDGIHLGARRPPPPQARARARPAARHARAAPSRP